MKVLFSVLGLLTSVYATQSFACVDVSGKYLLYGKFFIQYEQKSCETLTETWCSADGKDCSGSSYTWTLDGKMVQEGGNPSNWASIIPEGNTLHRHQLWDSGTQHNGNQCYWQDQWYSKDKNADLNVTYKLECLMPDGKTKVEMVTEAWQLVK